MNNFILIDQDKNALLIPSTNPVLPELIRSVGQENVLSHDTNGELIAFLKDFLKAGKTANG